MSAFDFSAWPNLCLTCERRATCTVPRRSTNPRYECSGNCVAPIAPYCANCKVVTAAPLVLACGEYQASNQA